MQYPELIFTKKELNQIIEEFFGKNTLLVADPYNSHIIEKYKNTIIVKNNFHSISYEDIKRNEFDKVLAIGGCSALDIGRAYAQGIKFIGIPTVLSTSCISVDISILRAKDKTRKVKTVVPDKIIIPLRAILTSDKTELEKWSSSGLGDLFANISAVIDFEYKNKSFSMKNIKKNASVAMEALDWVIDSFEGYNEEAIRKLALYLHNSCLEVIKAGHNNLSAGCEHEFYEKIIREQKYSNTVQTHGILVNIGTLLTTAIYGKKTDDNSLFTRIKCASEKLGLPINYKELKAIGIEKEHITGTLKELKPGSIISDYIKDYGWSIMEIFY